MDCSTAGRTRIPLPFPNERGASWTTSLPRGLLIFCIGRGKCHKKQITTTRILHESLGTLMRACVHHRLDSICMHAHMAYFGARLLLIRDLEHGGLFCFTPVRLSHHPRKEKCTSHGGMSPTTPSLNVSRRLEDIFFLVMPKKSATEKIKVKCRGIPLDHVTG